MFEPFKISNKRENDYPQLLAALTHLLEGEKDPVSSLANASALLNWYLDDINWIGFYIFNEDDNQLVLGPFQGLPACVRIAPGRGVCGRAFTERKTQIIDDVLEFPGHIACDSASRSELVVPIVKQGKTAAVLDIDSPSLNRFDALDAEWMEKIGHLLTRFF